MSLRPILVVVLACLFSAPALFAADKPTPPAPKVVDGDYPTSKITIFLKDASLEDLLDEISQLSGNSLIHLPEKWSGKPVTLDAKELPYWEAIDKLCSAMGNAYYAGDYSRKTGMGNGMCLMIRAKGRDVGAYTGPLALKVAYATHQLCFRPASSGGFGTFGFMIPNTQQDTLTYSIDYYWEDRLPVLADEGVVTKALAPDGKELKVLESKRGIVITKETNVRAFNGAISVTLADLPDKLPQVAELDGSVKLTYGSAEKTIKFDDVAKSVGKSVTEGDTTLTIVKADSQPHSLFLVVKLQKGDKTIQVPVYPYAEKYGFTLVGGEGKTVRGFVSTTPAAGPWGVTSGRPGPGAPAGPYAKTGQGGVRSQPLAEGESGVSFYSEEGVWTLIYTYPGDVWSKEYPFTIKNIPLP